MTKLLISDTCDVVARRKSDGHLFISAETQLASISQSLGINETIYGSIGNKPLTKMRGQKEVTSTVRNAFFDLEILSMTQGVAIEANGTASIYKREDDLTVVDNTGTLKVTITDTTVTTVFVRNKDGETVSATAATGSVTVPTGHAAIGDKVSVTYKKSVTGNVVTFDGEKFSEAYELEFKTIAYNPDTNQVVKDIYIQLDHAVPSGDFEMSFENGSAIAPEIAFDCLTAPNSTEIGRIIEVDRV